MSIRSDPPPGRPSSPGRYGVFVLVSVSLICTIGAATYRRYSREARDHTQRLLLSNASNRVATIRTHIVERFADAHLLSVHAELMASVDAALTADARAAAQRTARATMQQTLEAYGYHDLVLFDGDRRPVVALRRQAISAIADRALATAMSTRRAVIVPVHATADGSLEYGIAAPVVAGGGASVGGLYTAMDARRVLFPMLREARATSGSYEAVLLQRNGDAAEVMSTSRARRDERDQRRLLPIGDERFVASQAFLRGSALTIEGIDFRGTPVIGGAMPVPESPWVVEAKIDRAEAERPIDAVTAIVAATVLLLIALVVGLGWLLWTQRRAEFDRLSARIAARTLRVVRASMDGYVVFERAGRIVEANAAIAEILGYTEDELLERSIADLRAENSTESPSTALAEIQAHGKLRFATRWRRKDGRTVDLDVSALSMDGNERVDAFVRDVTEERAAQRRLERYNRLYAFLNNASETLFSLRTAQEAYEAVCRVAIADVDFRLVWVGVVDEAAGIVRPVAAAGSASRYVDQLRLNLDPALPTSHGPTVTSIRERAPGIANDFGANPHTASWHALAEEHGLRASASLPIVVGDRAVGAVMFYAGSVGFFEPELVALLGEIARFLALVVQSVSDRARRDEEQAARTLSEERFRGLFDASPLPIVVIGAASTELHRVNRAFTETFGWEAADLADVPTAFALFYPDPEARQRLLETWSHSIARLTPGVTVRSPESSVRCKDGSDRVVVRHITRVGDEIMIGWTDFTALRANQALTVEAQTIARMGVFSYDFRTKITTRSDSLLRLAGIDPSAPEAARVPVLGLITAEDRPRFEATVRRCTPAQPDLDETARIRAPDGRIAHVRFRARLAFDAAGEPLRAIGSHQDVTAEAEAAQELQRHRDHLEELVRARTGELGQANASLRRTDQRLKAMLGLSQRASGLAEREILELCIDEAVRLTNSELGYVHLVDEDADTITPSAWSASVREHHDVAQARRLSLATAGVWADAIRQRAPVKHNDVPAAGGREGFPGQHVAIRRHLGVPYVEGDRTRLILGVGNKRDDYDDLDAQELQHVAKDVWTIVQRRRAEVALDDAFRHVRESDQRFAYAMDAASEGIWDGDFRTNSAFYSPSCFTMLGYAPGTIPTTLATLLSLTHPDDAATLHSSVHRSLTETGTSSVEYRLRDASGHYRWILSRGKVVERDAQGRPLRAVGTHQDMTARREAEAKLVAAMEQANEANKAKSAFLATMSHEIRTPLNGVLGMAEILTQAGLPTRELDAIRMIQASGRTLLAVIDDILDFSKIEAGHLELDTTEFVLRDLVEDVCSSLVAMAASKEVDVYAFVAPELVPKLRCDPVRFRQILYNLTGNAIKFSGGGAGRRGRVEVELEPAADGSPSLVLLVRDNGIGMSAATQARLFKSFMQAEASTTRRFGGTGLGLAITRRLVEFMGGTITVASAEGAGSCFTVTLPLLPAAEQPPVLRPDLTDLDVILVAHDGCLNPRHAGRYLASSGARVHVVDTAADAAQLAGALGSVCVVAYDEHHADRAFDPLFADVERVRHVAISRGRRQRLRITNPSVVSVDCDFLRADKMLHVIAVASGRESPGAVLANGDSAAPEAISPVSVAEARARGELILVAEDDAVNQKVIQRQLELLGYACEIAANGVEALQLWRRGHYALLLTDLHMPEMDGYTLAREIRAAEAPGHRLPILALTANALRGEALRAEEAGIDGYLTKPVPLATLGATLKAWMHRGSGESAAAVAPEPPREPAARPEDEPTALDVAVLEGLVGDDPVVVRGFLREYRTVAEGHARDLHIAHDRRDYAEMARIAHKLKSASRSVGARPLGECCAELERAAKSGAAASVDPHVAAFEGLLQAVFASLAPLLGPPSGNAGPPEV